MFSDDDLDAAVNAGVMSLDSANAFRQFVQGRGVTQVSSVADEENFKLLTGFNDIFVALAGLLFFIGITSLNLMGTGVYREPSNLSLFFTGAIISVSAWGLAEFFTRRRRMALPSILFALAFVGGIFYAAHMMIWPMVDPGPLGIAFPENYQDSVAVNKWQAASNAHQLREYHAFAMSAIVGAVAAIGAAWVHWRRFHVPITIAIGAAAVAGTFVALIVSLWPWIQDHIQPLLLIPGIIVFVFAMRWDATDPMRRTHRSDVAFWLHMLAAPLIVHATFSLFGVFKGDASAGIAVVILALYVLFGFIAVIVDRRAMLVSSLVYVSAAIATLFRLFGGIESSVALSIMIIGGSLLLLSAWWQTLRGLLLRNVVTPRVAALLPPAADYALDVGGRV